MTQEQLWRKAQRLLFEIEKKEITNKFLIFPSDNDDSEFLETLQQLADDASISEISSVLNRLTNN